MAVRVFLFLWTIAVACPIRYWAITSEWDNTWVFAMNYAAAQGLFFGQDVIWTSGPLGHLAFPQDVGNNLAHALLFQCAVWAVLIAIFADLYFRAKFPLRNLTFFAVYFSMSGPLYWFNYMGLENLLLAGALVLLVMVRWRGGTIRYITALLLISMIPLIKLAGAMIACVALAGFLVDRLIHNRARAKQEIALAAIVLGSAAALWGFLFFPSAGALSTYLKASREVIGSYSAAVGSAGEAIEIAGAAQALAWIALLLFLQRTADRKVSYFYILLLTLPLFVSFKHGFVRQDMHVINYFGFAVLALALISLAISLDGRRTPNAMLVLLPMTIIWVEYIAPRIGVGTTIGQATGTTAIANGLRAIHFDALRRDLRAEAERNYPAKARIEPEIRAIVGDTPVASLSLVYNSAPLDGVHLVLYPVVERYLAYTPYLDNLNAAWIRDRGPQFLVFNWESIDQHNPWAETPAMWLEIYRWYETRKLGTQNLLLERRARPRFGLLTPVRRFSRPFNGPMDLPESPRPLFWTMHCGLNAIGQMQKAAFRLDAVLITVQGAGGENTFRIAPEVLTSPVLGNLLPSSLSELAAVLDAKSVPKPAVRKIWFGGPGIHSYQSNCDVTFLTAEFESAH